MKRSGPSTPHCATPSSNTDAIDTGKETHIAASQHRLAPAPRITLYARPASGAACPLSADGMHAPAQHGSDRREHYAERGPQPSFAFADIDDAQVLKVEAEQRLAMQPMRTARPAQTEQSQRLSDIAAVIKKMMEGEVASVLKALARLAQQEGAGQSGLQGARQGFSLFIKHFQQAKLAAGDGRHTDMKAALALALAELARFAGQAGDGWTRHFRTSRSFRADVLPWLQALSGACSTWAEVADPLSERIPASERGDAETLEGVRTEARARAVSSPAPVQPSPERARARSVSSATSSSGKTAATANAGAATADRVEGARTPSSPGRKLKAFFSRSSETRMPRGRAGSEPASSPSRAGPNPGLGGDTTATTPASTATTATTTTTTTRTGSPLRADRKVDADN